MHFVSKIFRLWEYAKLLVNDAAEAVVVKGYEILLLFGFSNKSSSFLDITGSFLESSDEENKEDNETEQNSPEVLEILGFQVLDSSVVVTPSKVFEFDTSESEAIDSKLSNESNDSDSETKYMWYI